MLEVTNAGEDHCETMFFSGSNYFLIAH